MKMRLRGYLLAHRDILKHESYIKPRGVKVRFLPNEYEPTTTFIVIKDKLGIYNLLDEENPFIILINSQTIAQSYRQQFLLMWATASET